LTSPKETDIIHQNLISWCGTGRSAQVDGGRSMQGCGGQSKQVDGDRSMQGGGGRGRGSGELAPLARDRRGGLNHSNAVVSPMRCTTCYILLERRSFPLVNN
jgi:hypothetical protein